VWLLSRRRRFLDEQAARLLCRVTVHGNEVSNGVVTYRTCKALCDCDATFKLCAWNKYFLDHEKIGGLTTFQVLFMCTFLSLLQLACPSRPPNPLPYSGCSHVMSSLCALYRRPMDPVQCLFLIGPNMYRRGPQAIFDSRRRCPTESHATPRPRRQDRQGTLLGSFARLLGAAVGIARCSPRLLRGCSSPRF
jgi:hypothetical protein